VKVLLTLSLAACGGGAVTPRSSLERVAYPNGKARFEFELRDGFPNGRGRAWHPNGKPASDGTYQDGARHGRFWFYNDDGSFAAQALYVDNEEVWRSTDERATPPQEWSEAFAANTWRAPTDAMKVDVGSELPWDEYRKAPRAYFSTLDRTTASARAGAQLGVSDAKELGFGAATRLDLFGHYRVGRFGVFAEFSETHLALENDMTLWGRRGAILQGTYHHPIGPAMLSTNGGFVIPLGNPDVAGSVASHAGAEQRPAELALAIPSLFGLRSGASLTASRGHFLVQVDAGFDWMMGGNERGLDVLGRANIGVGFGSRASMLTAELNNVFRLSSQHPDLHALAVGGTVSLPIMWMSASLVFSEAGTTSFLGTVGRDL
jgi:hypothetical protein